MPLMKWMDSVVWLVHPAVAETEATDAAPELSVLKRLAMRLEHRRSIRPRNIPVAAAAAVAAVVAAVVVGEPAAAVELVLEWRLLEVDDRQPQLLPRHRRVGSWRANV